jgi:hypothetical protein
VLELFFHVQHTVSSSVSCTASVWLLYYLNWIPGIHVFSNLKMVSNVSMKLHCLLQIFMLLRQNQTWRGVIARIYLRSIKY